MYLKEANPHYKNLYLICSYKHNLLSLPFCDGNFVVLRFISIVFFFDRVLSVSTIPHPLGILTPQIMGDYRITHHLVRSCGALCLWFLVTIIHTLCVIILLYIVLF